MTKLQSKDFLLHEKLIKKFYTKGAEYTESIYLDFNSNRAMCMTSKGDYLFFPFTYDGDKLNNFFINSDKFLLLCKSYDEISLEETKNSVTFLAGKDKFNIGILAQDYDVDFDFNTDKMNLLFDLGVDKTVSREFSQVLPFVSLENAASTTLLHIFYAKGFCYGYTSKCIFKVASPIKKDMYIKAELINFLKCFEDQEQCKIFMSDTKYIITNSSAYVISSTYSDVTPPNLFSDTFVQAYSTDKYLKVEKGTILSSLKVFEGFNKENPDYVLFLSYKDGEFSIESRNTDVIKKSVDVVETNIEQMEEMVVKAKLLQSVLTSIDDAYVYIYNDSAKKAFEVRNGMDDWTAHAICTKVNIN
jgi:hypothetical protein